jgi:hypothetical protein
MLRVVKRFPSGPFYNRLSTNVIRIASTSMPLAIKACGASGSTCRNPPSHRSEARPARDRNGRAPGEGVTHWALIRSPIAASAEAFSRRSTAGIQQGTTEVISRRRGDPRAMGVHTGDRIA